MAEGAGATKAARALGEIGDLLQECEEAAAHAAREPAGAREGLGEVEGERDAVQGVRAQVVFAVGGEGGDDRGH